MNDILLYFAVKYEGDFEKIYYAIMNKEKCDYDEVVKVKKEIKCKYTTVISNNYPKKLKHLNRPPFVIFYEGDLSLIDKTSLSVIGSRNNGEYGKIMCEKIVKELVDNNIVIISGLAKGIDSIAHRVALKNHGKTIGVLGNGINYYYPKENQDIQNEIDLLVREVDRIAETTSFNNEIYPLMGINTIET